MTQVRHESENNRYVLDVDGEIAGVAEYSVNGQERVFDHTVIHDEFQGQGLSKPLIQAALDDTKAHGIAYRATCSAVGHFIAKNPEYQ